jgi:hypothetical protein
MKWLPIALVYLVFLGVILSSMYISDSLWPILLLAFVPVIDGFKNGK